MSIVKTDPIKVQAMAAAVRVVELKQLLANSDYKVFPGYDRPTESIMAQRQAWRDEIRALEGGLT
jgi:hypothetical protein